MGTKVLVGSTGLLLVLYLIVHLFGNLVFLLGPTAFNAYANMMASLPIVVPIEIGLLFTFLLHVYKAATNWVSNRRARPSGYYRRIWGGRPSRKTVASSTMIGSGLILLAFIPIHVAQMKFGAGYNPAFDARRHDLYAIELAVFSNPLNVSFYCLCMIIVGGHLFHGVHSAFQSLGADHPKYTRWILVGGKLFALLVGFGFFSIPLFAYFLGEHA
ncbi:MAG: succinate dehydrogenase cytochrome b subunit [Chloroflexota bacterium]